MELPLRDGGACCLGNINLTSFVINPFTRTFDINNSISIEEFNSVFDIYRWVSTIISSVRFLDNVIDITKYPYEFNSNVAKEDRRIGLNCWAGIGSFLALLRVPYDSKLAGYICRMLGEIGANTAYITSISLAKEKGSFPNLGAPGSQDRENFANSYYISKLDPNIKQNILQNGIRNCALLTIPPVGTGSLLLGNISNGLEPIFALEYNRKIKNPDDSYRTELLEDYAWRKWKQYTKSAWISSGEDGYKLQPKEDFFKTSMDIDPKDHINVQSAIQYWIDGSVSKTVNISNSYTLDEYKKLILYSHSMGCRGFTSFRDGTRDGVLSVIKDEKQTTITPTLPTMTIKERPRILDGRTYQLKDNSSKRAYCTINYINDNGIKRPWEVFLFSKSEHHEWYAALGVLISAVMRKIGSVDFIIKDLKEISGDYGYITPEYGYIGSKPQHVAFVLEEFISSLNGQPDPFTKTSIKCPECGEYTVTKEGGCEKCLSCNYSKCG